MAQKAKRRSSIQIFHKKLPEKIYEETKSSMVNGLPEKRATFTMLFRH